MNASDVDLQRSRSTIRHIVLFKFDDGISWGDPRALAAEKITLEHPRHIPEIAGWQAGRSVAERAEGYDFALIGDFADHTALSGYMTHPHHQRGVTAWRAISTWVVADLDLGSVDAVERSVAVPALP